VITLAQTGYFGVFEKILRRHVRSAIRFDSSANVTDAGLEHLKGVHTMNLSGCHQFTDAGLKHLKGGSTPDSLCLLLVKLWVRSGNPVKMQDFQL